MSTNVTIKSAGRKGRGVFASKFLNRGAPVLQDPVLVIKKPDISSVNKSIMKNYAFYLCGKYMFDLGPGSLLNHSDQYNLHYSFNKILQTIDFYAVRHIDPGEELVVDYGWDFYPWAKKKI